MEDDFYKPDGLEEQLVSARHEFTFAAMRPSVEDAIGVVFVLHNGMEIFSNNVASDASQMDGYDEITMVRALEDAHDTIKHVVVCRRAFENSADPEAFKAKYERFKDLLAAHPAAGDDLRVYTCAPDSPQIKYVSFERV